MSHIKYLNQNDNNLIFPIGGIGTSSVGVTYDGTLCNYSLCFDPLENNDDSLCLFNITAHEAENKCSSSPLVSGSKRNSCFYETGLEIQFPFVKKVFKSETFPAKITQTVFNPFIPYSETDSAIPCVFFEFEILNTSDAPIKYELCGTCSNIFNTTKNSVGCTDNGALYIEMLSKDNDMFSRENNLCFATDAKSFSYNEYSDTEKENNGCSIRANLFLHAGEQSRVRFALSWHFPVQVCIDNDGNTVQARNYYAHYFQSSTECIDYCFAQWDRLKSDTLRFTNTLALSTLPENIKRAVNTSLFILKTPLLSRFNNGELVAVKETNKGVLTFSRGDILSLSIPLLYMFPTIYKNNSIQTLKYASKNKEKLSFIQKLYFCIMAYQSFMLEGDIEQLIETWYNLAKTLEDALCLKDNNLSFGKNTKEKTLCICALRCTLILSEIVNDKDKTEQYRSLLTCALKNISELEYNSIDQAEGLFLIQFFGFSDLLDNVFLTEILTSLYQSQMDCQEVSDNVYLLCYLLLKNNLFDMAASLMCKGQYAIDAFLSDKLFYEQKIKLLLSYSLIHCVSGFDYDAFDKTINVKPDLHCADKTGTFRSFISFGSGYGYVEQGIDYVEINVLSGKLTIRNFGTSSRPLMVLYGGRKWKFEDTGLCARLDCDLTVTPDKKLTIIIDVKKQN